MAQHRITRTLPHLAVAFAIAISPAALWAERAAATLDATVLDVKIMDDFRVDDLKLAEASGVSFDPDDNLLRLVSDRGRVFAFDLDVTNNRFAAITPISAVKLRNADGKQMRKRGFNAEGLETRNSRNGIPGDSSLLIVSETGPSIAMFTPDGALVSLIPVPVVLRDPSAQRSPRDGLESIALHPDFGLLTAPEEPLRAQPRQTHTLYGREGALFSYDASDAGSTSIKALEVLDDGRILILEMLKSSDKLTLTPILRTLNPEACTGTGDCPTRWTALHIPQVTDATFEGIADIGGGLLVIVSDDKIDGQHRTVFGLIKL